MFLADLPPQTPTIVHVSQDRIAVLVAEARADYFSGDLEGFLSKQQQLLATGYYLPVPIRTERPIVNTGVPASVRYGCITE